MKNVAKSLPQRGLSLAKPSHSKAFPSPEITPTRCWVSYSNGFCFRNMIPCSFDYLIYPYYPAYTMGCYQIVISGDNGREGLLFVLLVCDCNYITKDERMQPHSPSRLFPNRSSQSISKIEQLVMSCQIFNIFRKKFHY